jgi:hypothetical protein
MFARHRHDTIRLGVHLCHPLDFHKAPWSATSLQQQAHQFVNDALSYDEQGAHVSEQA